MSEEFLDSQSDNCEVLVGRKDKHLETAGMAAGASEPEDILERLMDKIEKLAGSVNILQHKFAIQSQKLDSMQPSSNEDSETPQPKQTNLDSSKNKSRNFIVQEKENH